MRSWSNYSKTIQAEPLVFEAARKADLETLSVYLRGGGDPQVKNHKGHSLLMLAAYHGHEKLVELLIEAMADVNSLDENGNTILMGVAFKGHMAVAWRLLLAGADPQIRNSLGQTALSYAQLFGREGVANLLIAFLNFPKNSPEPGKVGWGRRFGLLVSMLKSVFINKLTHSTHP